MFWSLIHGTYWYLRLIPGLRRQSINTKYDHGDGIPIGKGIPRESHGNGTNIESIVGIGMGTDLDGNGNNPILIGNNSRR